MHETTRNILIADGGSTKVEWLLTDTDGNTKASFISDGFNVARISQKDAVSYFSDVRKKMDPAVFINEIHYYGSGAATPEICSAVENAIREVWNPEVAEVQSDMLAACRVTEGTPGIVCILGTGSNSAFFDGKKIIRNIPPLGFILGDEGGGTALGKRLLGDIFKEIAPKCVCDAFFNETGLSKGDVIEKVYRSAAPNIFLASFVPFIKKHLDNSYVNSLVRQEFRRFISRNVARYENSHSYPVSYIGSVAYHFRDILREVTESEGFKVGLIEQHPMSGLKIYHSGYHVL